MPTVKITRAEAEAYVKDFDFSKIDALSDEDIARQVADNVDAAPLLQEGEDYTKWSKVRGRPSAKVREALVSRSERVSDPAIDMAALRNRLAMTQAEFARAFRFSPAAVRAIEQGRRKPSGPTAAYLELIAADPDYVRLRLAKGEAKRKPSPSS